MMPINSKFALVEKTHRHLIQPYGPCKNQTATDGTNLWLYVGWHVDNLHGNKVGL